jgi:uncharacterized protein YjbI with pentapeptide repeats
VLSPETGEAIRLDDEIGMLLQRGRYPLIRLTGGPGSGKTMALRHLAAALPPWALAQVRLLDEPEDHADVLALGDPSCRLAISTGHPLAPNPGRFTFRIASWSQDDLIEYLLSAHPDHCATVMSRLRRADDREFIGGIPELWTIILDRMAHDESIATTHTALHYELAARLGNQARARRLAEDFCLSALKRNADLVLDVPHSLLSGDPSSRARQAVDIARLVRHRPVALLLAADRVVAMAQHGEAKLGLTGRLPRDLVHEAAQQLIGNVLALGHLEGWVKDRKYSAVHPMAASLLYAAMSCWRPAPGCQPRLQGAYLDRACWPDLSLPGANLQSADLERADLSRANLSGARADQARLSGAILRDARLGTFVARGADLSGADLRSVRALSADFQQANLAHARLTDAQLGSAELQGANIESADFTDANLKGAVLSGLQLRLAQFEGAFFGWADLRRCDLEGMELTAPDFRHADLREALLTGSRMHDANFERADLRDAGLAEIDWTGANLRGADLRGANFHLGSTRDGLVGSPIACEGSRTGFYTDDYHDRDLKPAEEIRKANLRRADLRGANIKDVDFYLVDLRDAKYTTGQAEHFRHCRAILRGG